MGGPLSSFQGTPTLTEAHLNPFKLDLATMPLYDTNASL